MGLDLNQQWAINSLVSFALALSINNLLYLVLEKWFPKNSVNEQNNKIIFWAALSAFFFAAVYTLQRYVLDPPRVRDFKAATQAVHEVAAAEAAVHILDPYDMHNRQMLFRKLRGSSS